MSIVLERDYEDVRSDLQFPHSSLHSVALASHVNFVRRNMGEDIHLNRNRRGPQIRLCDMIEALMCDSNSTTSSIGD